MLLYLHIPFCHRVCPYCSFYKHTPGGTSVGRFVEALGMEAATRLAGLPAAPRTLYLGGGTPSMLSPRHLARLFGRLRAQLDFALLDEVTLEANPATFDRAKARLFRDLGVTRVSLGVQSFAAHVLATLGREHTADEAAEAVDLLRGAGIPQVNIDLMFSVPGQSPDDWERTLRRAVDLRPEHVSAYNLTYEEDTAFFEALRSGDAGTSEDVDAAMFETAAAFLTDNGFGHYETSNYARPGARSSHNQGYWRGEDYLGLGPSAVTTVGGWRWRNVADTAAYIEQVNATGHALAEAEELDPEARRIERIALGLRTCEGIDLSLLDAAALQRAKWLEGEGLVRIEADRLVVAGRGRALVDPIAAELV